MYLLALEMFDQLTILYTAGSVTDPIGLQKMQGLPNALRSASLTCMCRAIQATLSRIPISAQMRIQRKTSLVCCEIKTDYKAALEFMDETCCFQTLSFCKMTQGTENQANFNATAANHPFGRSLDNPHNTCGRQTIRCMQQGSKPDFRVDNSICNKLLKQIFYH